MTIGKLIKSPRTWLAVFGVAAMTGMTSPANAVVHCYGCWTDSKGKEHCRTVAVGGYACTTSAFCAAVGGCGSSSSQAPAWKLRLQIRSKVKPAVRLPSSKRRLTTSRGYR